MWTEMMKAHGADVVEILLKSYIIMSDMFIHHISIMIENK